MQLYKNNPEYFGDFRKQVLAKTIPLMLGAVLVGLTIAYFSENSTEAGIQSTLVYTFIIVAYFTYSFFRGSKRQRTIFDSYQLIIGDDYLQRKQSSLADKTISFNAVNSITEDKRRNLYIRGASKEDLIYIYSYVEDYEEIRAILQSIKPITTEGPKGFLQKYSTAFILAILGLMATVYIVNNKIVVSIAGVLLIATLIWCFYKIRTSTFFDEKIKRSAWFVFFLIFCIALSMYFKLFVNFK
ncbi:hypothetical protein [Mucilaginibacter psychrotolerans]|uniref:Uncharacterized protein n=1 Tax=Mucilaginibacter psychrotolerans TaxID=1524096 RepID=A0A4Y8SBF9_9SPHI|nr:hypothetical protein [Mucilaginibacter psychrotolerans]TFF36308.1 hypothetical protein E2R66_15850 [Mucilaginibacter psychrotolerans]